MTNAAFGDWVKHAIDHYYRSSYPTKNSYQDIFYVDPHPHRSACGAPHTVSTLHPWRKRIIAITRPSPPATLSAQAHLHPEQDPANAPPSFLHATMSHDHSHRSLPCRQGSIHKAWVDAHGHRTVRVLTRLPRVSNKTPLRKSTSLSSAPTLEGRMKRKSSTADVASSSGLFRRGRLDDRKPVRYMQSSTT